ncbi:MAG TPA: hypothetical protein VF629_22485, partial [Hymenobacter sp.]|uniref:hypothetical protein n=1 Tax=Hymenobacter sp. TaxID=1898978 RepID=UPI002ED85629
TPARKPAPARPAPKPAPKATPASAPSAEPEVPTLQEALGINVGMVERPLVVNLGLGVGNDFGYGFGQDLESTPALTLSVDKTIIEGVGPGAISVGGLVGYQNFRYNYPGTDFKATWNHIVVLARGAYHYNFTEDPRLDTYGGVSLGLRAVTYKNTFLDSTPADEPDDYGGLSVAPGIFVGGRYFLTDHLGAFAELGYDMSYLKFGLTARF